MEKENLQNLLTTNTNSLLKTIKDFKNDSFNERLIEDSWSAAEIVEHLFLLDNLILKVLYGPTESAIDYNKENKNDIASVFQNIDKKLSAPDSIAPKGLFKNKEEAEQKIKETRLSVEKVVNELLLNEICLGFDHRFFGKLTREDWIYFIVQHCERHLIQLQKICTSFN